jgi:TolA-binding protein
MKKYLWVGLLLISNSVFGVFEDEDARKKINDIQGQLNNIQNNIEFTIKEKFIQYENAEKNQSNTKRIIELNNRISSLYDELAKLNGEIEVLKYQVKNSEDRHKVLYQELIDRLYNIENSPQASEKKKLEAPAVVLDKELKKSDEALDISLENSDLPPLVDKSIELEDFARAEKFRKATKYKKSFDAYDKFITSYRDSDFIVDAKFGLGYSQYALKNYNAAIKTYLKIIEQYPDDGKISFVIYEIANCEIQLTRITRAKKTLRGLIKKYPNSDIIPSAKKRLKALESIKL